MQVAILTDLPILCEDTMYVDEIRKALSRKGVHSKIFLVKNSGILQKLDPMTGAMRIMNTSRLLSKLSHYDLIHAQLTYPLGFAFTLFASLRLLNKPVIVHTHGYDVFTIPKINYGIRRNWIGRILTSYTWKRADRVIVVCKKAKAEIESIGIRADNIDLLYNGIDELLFDKKSTSDIPKGLSLLRSENDFIFLSIASITPVKNHVRLVKAFSELVEKYKFKYKIRLLIIGTNYQHQLVDYGGLNDSILYVGKKNHFDLPLYYSISDAFVLPSLSEAHPWSMLEAMSCQLPVIASNVGGIPETLDEPRFLVNPQDAQVILKKLEMVITMDKNEREQIGINNRAKVLSSFTLDRHTNQLIDIYESAYNKRPA